MAIRGASCGFEMPKLDGDLSGYSGMGQDVYETIFGRATQPNTTRKHSGNNSVFLDTLDALYQQLNAHVEPFSGSRTKQWWTGFHSPNALHNVVDADEVYIAQLTDNATLVSPADRKHLVLLGVATLASPNTFRYRVSIAAWVSGTLTLTTLITDTVEVDPAAVGSTDWYMYTIQYDDTVGSFGGIKFFLKLNGDAVQIGSEHVLLSGEKSGLQLDAFHCLDTRNASGKGGTTLSAYFDDIIANDDQDGAPTVRPVDNIEIIRATICADTAEDDWTGNPDTADKYKNWDDDVDATFNDPTSTTNHRQVSDAEELDTGTIYGIRVVHSADNLDAVPHDLRCGISGAFRTYTDPGNGDSTGGDLWHGREFSATPEASPVAWTTAKFNALGVGVEAKNTARNVGSLWVNVIGENLVLKGCPVAAGFVPRVMNC